jgi:hypothetical protein
VGKGKVRRGWCFCIVKVMPFSFFCFAMDESLISIDLGSCIYSRVFRSLPREKQIKVYYDAVEINTASSI